MQNILEASTDAFFIKIAFRGFLLCPDPFLECQRFMNLAVYFIRARSSLIGLGEKYQAADEVDCKVHKTLTFQEWIWT